MRRFNGRCLRLLPLISIVLLGGCIEQSASDLLTDFQQRIERPLEVDVDDITPSSVTLPSYPPRRERLQTHPDIREGVIDVLAFRHCNMLDLIAERNSILGKVAPFSQRYLYELHFIAMASQCLPSLDDTNPDLTDFRQQLQQVLNTKRQDLRQGLIDLIYNSEETEKQFSRSALPLQPMTKTGQDDDSDQGFQASLTALDTLIYAARQTQLAEKEGIYPMTLNSAELEVALATLHHSDFGARLLQSLQLITNQLNDNASLITTRLNNRPVCYRQQPNETGKIAQNVFNRYYASGVQPYLAQVYQQARAWRQRWMTLNQLAAPLPAELQRYQVQLWEGAGSVAELGQNEMGSNRPTSIWQAYLLAQQRHTNAWQALLSQCGLMPGQKH